MSLGEHYVLIAGRSALPLLARRLAQLQGERVLVLCECGPADRVPAAQGADLRRVVCEDDRPYALYEALRGLHLPQGETRVWLACGRAQAAMIRRQLTEDHGVAPHRIESPVTETVTL